MRRIPCSQDGAVLVEIALGVILMMVATFGVIAFAQGIAEANSFLDSTRYSARNMASPVIEDPEAPPITLASPADEMNRIKLESVDLAKAYLNIQPADEPNYNVTSDVYSVIEDKEEFWIVKVEVGKVNDSIGGVLASLRPLIKSKASSAFLIQGVEQGT